MGMKKFLGLMLVLMLATASHQAWAMSRSKERATKPKALKATKAKSTTKKKRARYRRIAWNPVLRGSYQSMLRQNEEIDRLELPRIQNDDELESMILRQELVGIEETNSLKIADNIEPTKRFCRPWTNEFLTDLSEAYYQEFRRPIQVNSAVRTVEQQRKLRRHNRNAAPIDGDTASSHLAGTTVDLAKRGLSRKEKKWLDAYLKNLADQGLIEAAEERRQACYHIMVTSKYSEWRNASDTVAEEKTATVAQ
jgi:hypothetical protein